MYLNHESITCLFSFFLARAHADAGTICRACTCANKHAGHASVQFTEKCARISQAEDEVLRKKLSQQALGLGFEDCL